MGEDQSQSAAAQANPRNHLQHLPELTQLFTMIAVKGDMFDMGGESWDKSSLPVHPVKVDDFWMGQYPVTQALWMAVMGDGNNPAHFKGWNRPVENVSWDLITNDFLPVLNQKTVNSRPLGTLYRLPTEAEWEYTARGGMAEAGTIYSGSKHLDEVGWYGENSHSETKPVGLKLPNELSIYDMTGNVWEWCLDWYDSDYYQKCFDGGLVNNPKGAEQGTFRVFRGGSCSNDAKDCRSTNRCNYTPAFRDYNLGFRLILFSLPV